MRRTVFWKFVAGRQLAPRMGYFRDQGVVMLNLRGSGGYLKRLRDFSASGPTIASS
jgi:hypothetical protein